MSQMSLCLIDIASNAAMLMLVLHLHASLCSCIAVYDSCMTDQEKADMDLRECTLHGLFLECILHHKLQKQTCTSKDVCTHTQM